MRGKWSRSRGLLAGSGAVEAGRKTVTGQRPKLPGMSRTVTGADTITAPRCRDASSQGEPSAAHRIPRQAPLTRQLQDDLAHLKK
jgi:hypothetical protein